MAVSGGVDSVALLHALQEAPGVDLVVAHFDHGIRDDSYQDAAFVKDLAQSYKLPFESRREELGSGASEELARSQRYAFLREVALNHNATIITAHHADDTIETIAINLTRGTGWRGLAVLDSDVVRPLLHVSKTDIIAYAKKHHLTWREDSTNASDAYLRNRIRQKTALLADDAKHQLLALRVQQVDTKRQIDEEVAELIGPGPQFSRYFFTHADSATAVECLRFTVQARLTRPQLSRSLLAIKTAKPGSLYQAGGGIQFRFTSRNFTVELIK